MTEYGLSWKGLFMRAFHPRSSKDTIKLSVSVSVSQDAAPVCMLLDWDSLLWWMLHIWHGRSHMPMELRSLAIWQLWTGGTDDPSFHVAQLQVCGSVAAGICLNQRKEGRGGCWHLSLLGRGRLCDVGVWAGCRDRPETDMTGPLTRARLHAGSNAAVQHKQDFCSLHWACSETHSWQLRRLSRCEPLASQQS